MSSPRSDSAGRRDPTNDDADRRFGVRVREFPLRARRASPAADRHKGHFWRQTRCWRSWMISLRTWGALTSACSNAAEDDDGRRARQRIPRNPQAPFGSLVDLELLTDPAHELVERGCEAMHRQYHRRAQMSRD